MNRFAKHVVSAAAAACLIVGTGAFAETPAGGTSGTQGGSSQSGGSGSGGTSGSGQTGSGQTGSGQSSGGQTGGSQTGSQSSGQSSNQGTGAHEGAAHSQGLESHGQMQQALTKADSPDKLFLVHVAVHNQVEMQMAQLAQQKSQNAQVKQVAEAILKDHGQMGQSLQKLIEQQGLTAPTMIPALAQQEMKVAQGLSGEEFDQMFISGQKAGHMMAISKFEDKAKTAKDSSVKQFAAQFLPALQQHASLVQQAAVAVGLPSGNEAQTAGSRIPPSDTGTSGSTSGGTSGTSGSSGSRSGGTGNSGGTNADGTGGTGTSGNK